MTPIARSLLILIVLLTVKVNLYAQDWKLHSDQDSIKIYTTLHQESKLRMYKLIAVVNTDPESVFEVLTDRKMYLEVHKKLSRYDIIEETDSSRLVYSCIDMPWPLMDRDMISEINVTKIENSIIVNSVGLDIDVIPPADKVIRIRDYNQKYILRKLGENRTELNISGFIDLGGMIPLWLQNLIVFEGPVNLVNKVRERCEME